MKVSAAWLQKYFDAPLPTEQELADAFTFRSFEVDEQDGDLLDLKVLPDRAGYALSHRGVATELAAALVRTMKDDPLAAVAPKSGTSDAIRVELADERCLRYVGAVMKGVKVGPSPAWLREALESVGQRSINNVVDATNYVMLDLGQPLHAFDAAKLSEADGAYAVTVRGAEEGEAFTSLSGETYELPEGTLVIADGNSGAALGVAGVKGGKAAGIDRATTDIVIESANFDGTAVRRAAQKLRLVTDASIRFQNRPSPELAAYGMRAVTSLIQELAGGEIIGVTDVYPNPAAPVPVSITVGRVNGILGSSYGKDDVVDVFHRLALPYVIDGETFTVTPPFWRTDLVIPEDLAEEVGRLMGYDRIEALQLPPPKGEPDQARFRGMERMKDQMVEQGFVEVSTQSFAKKGDVYLANPLDKSKPALRTSLEKNLGEALARAKEYAPLALPPGGKPKLFEVGSVFPKEGEYVELRMTETAWEGVPTSDNLSVAKLEDYGKDYAPRRCELSSYEPFSAYPFVLRDIAAWVPADADAGAFESIIRENAGALLVRLSHVDEFSKDGRMSHAFRLVFQSYERTLTDDEVNGIMEQITAALASVGYEVR